MTAKLIFSDIDGTLITSDVMSRLTLSTPSVNKLSLVTYSFPSLLACPKEL